MLGLERHALSSRHWIYFPIGIATALTNDNSQRAILVADECLLQARVRLAEILRGFENRVRLVTIDNAKERSRTLAPELQVQRTSEQETLSVLDANFDSVPPERRRTYAGIAGGFLRFAIYMCAHDSEIQETGNLSSALSSARSYYESRFSGGLGFDQRDRDALEIVALVDRVGYRGDRKTDLDDLCKIVGRDSRDIRERLERIRTQTGFISSAGRFYYVTPALVAMIAFESAWQRWAAPDPEGFLKAIPEQLIESFHERVSSAPPEVGATVGHFFRGWTATRGPGILESEPETRRLVALVAADPKTQTPLLRALVESASEAQIKGNTRGPRRLLVSVAEELAQFGSFFVDAEAILLRLALSETEPSIGNNATGTWKTLFRIFLSGTEVPFSQRYEILRRRFAAESPAERKLVISAAAAAVDQNAFRMVGPPLFGSLVPPKEWRPQTYGEYFDAIRNSLGLLLDGTFDSDSGVCDVAKQALLSATSHLLWAGHVDPVREALEGKLSKDMRPRLAALVRESYSRANSPDIRNQSGQSRMALEKWLTSLKSETLHERLIENIAAQPWSHHFEEQDWRNRVADLARELFDDSQALATELPWLNSNEAKAAVDLGHYLGLRDQRELRFLDEIIKAAIDHHADSLARGYLFGVIQSEPGQPERLNQALDRVQEVDPRLAFFIMLPAGDLLHTFDRAMSMVSARQISPHLLSNFQVWVGNRKTTPEEVASVVKLLIPLIRAGDGEAGSIAVDFVAYLLNRLSSETQMQVLREVFGETLEDLWILLDSVVSNPGREGFWFAVVLSKVAESNPNRACDIAASMVLSDSFQFSRSGDEVFGTLAGRYPEQVMEAIGVRMMDEKTRNQFFYRKFPVLTALPIEVTKSWLLRVGVKGAQAIARHLQAPFVDNNGPQVPPLTAFVLTEFEDDQRTFAEFVAGVHSYQAYVGSYADAREREGSLAKVFLTSPVKRIREWAAQEVRRAEEEARIHSIQEEELGFRG
jgi:hypothetical protein